MEEERLNSQVAYDELCSHITDNEDLQHRVYNALTLAFSYAQIDGSHHRIWVIDQMVRMLTGDQYDKWIEVYQAGEPDEEGYGEEDILYEWDTGIAP